MLSKLYGHFLSKHGAWFWKHRHWWDRKWPQGYTSKESLEHPHRQLILNALEPYAPFFHVLELGCGGGANLYLISENKLISDKYYTFGSALGIDISREVIYQAEDTYINRFMDFCVQDIRLCEWRFPKNDALVTDAMLIYLMPEEMGRVVEAIKECVLKVAVFCEWHSDEGPFVYDGHWVHNFKELFSGCELRKLTWQDWQDDGWSTYGHIITWIR